MFPQNCFFLTVMLWLGLDLQIGVRCWRALQSSDLPEVRAFVVALGMADKRASTTAAIAAWLKANGLPEKLIFMLEHLCATGVIDRATVNQCEEKILEATGRSGRWTGV